MGPRFRVWYILQKEKRRLNLDLPEETLERLALVLGNLWEKGNKSFIEVLREGRQWGVLEELED